MLHHWGECVGYWQRLAYVNPGPLSITSDSPEARQWHSDFEAIVSAHKVVQRWGTPIEAAP